MGNRSDHREAVARRLELLRAELAPPDESLDEPPTPRYLELVSDEPEERGSPGPDVRDAAVPTPGRHAARRTGRGPALPETVRGRIALGPWHVAVVALVLVAALAITCWRMVRSESDAPLPGAAPAAPLVDGVVATADGATAASSAPSAASTPASTGATTSDSPAPSASVTVDVAGKVRHPGVLVLPAGSRVVDAVAAAGGARSGVSLAGLNQARVLVDGEQIVVGQRQPSAPAGAGMAGGPSGASDALGGALVNLNTATPEQLEALPQVGPVTAQAIVAWREEHGGFGSVDELLEIDGIGEKTLAQISPHVTV